MWSQSRWRLGGLICGLWSVLCAAEEQPARARTTVAIVAPAESPAEGSQSAVLEGLLSLTEVALQDDPQLDVVERRRLQRNLQELLLQPAGQISPDARLQLGKLLSAEFLVSANWLAAEKDMPPLLQVRVVEARTGVIRGLQAVPCSEDNFEETAHELARFVIQTISAPQAELRTIAVAPFESDGRFDRLRPLELGVRDLITARLLHWVTTVPLSDDKESEPQRPRLLVLQRSNLGDLLRELDLTQSGLVDSSRLPKHLPTRATAFLLQGRLKERHQPDGLVVIVQGELVHAATRRPVAEFQFESTLEQLPENLAREIDRLVQRQWGLTFVPDASPRAQERGEIDALFRQTVVDLSRISRRSPTDFAPLRLDLRDADQRITAQSAVAADSLLGRHLLRKSIDRLETVLLIRPLFAPAALALGYSYSFQLADLYHPDRAEEWLRRAVSIEPAGQTAAQALELLAELGFHHDGGAPPADQKAPTVTRLAFAFEHMPAMHRNHRWPRWLALLQQLAVELNDFDTLQRILPVAMAWAEDPGTSHRYLLALNTASLAAALAEHPQANLAYRSAGREALQRWTASDDWLLQQLACSRLARLAEREKDWKAAARWYSTGALAAGKEPTPGGQHAKEHLTMQAARCYRLGGEPALALDLLLSLSPIPKVRAGSLNRGQYGLELGECYELLGEPEAALQAYLAGAEANPGIIDNSPILIKIQKLGGVPLREDRDIEVKYHSLQLPAKPFAGRCVATDGQRLLVSVQQPAGGKPGAQGSGIAVYDPQQQIWSWVSAPLGDVTALECDGTRLWAGTRNEGLWRCELTSEIWTHWTTENGLPDARIQSLAGHGTTMYAGVGTQSSGGLVRIDEQDQLHVFEDELAPTLAPSHIVVTEQRVLTRSPQWLHELNLQTKTWSRQSEVAPSRLQPPQVPAIFAGTTGVWASAYGRELFRLEPGPADASEFAAAWFPEGMSQAGYNIQFLSERDGQVWFGGTPWDRFSSSGLYRFDLQRKEFIKYGPRDGFQSGLSVVHDGVWLQDRLWLATSRGLVSVQPRTP